jgi:hypothetical protein
MAALAGSVKRFMLTTSYSPFKLVSAAGVNATLVNPASSLLGFLSIGNVSTAGRFVHVYDLNRVPVPGVDVPVLTFIAPGDVTGTTGTGTNISVGGGAGCRFLNGLAFAITAGAADTDATVIGANEVVVSLGYAANFD